MQENNNNIIHSEEKTHLEEIQSIIDRQLEETADKLEEKKETILEQKRYLWENIYELDPEEIVFARVDISNEHDSHDFTEKHYRLLNRLKENTYFGRIDFLFEGEEEPEIIYIGLGGLQDKTTLNKYIYDWRAPISSMYYDFDKGPAYYMAPMGKMEGSLTQKRQLKVRNGKLEYAFVSDYKIDDEILQRELSASSSTKMRNIVATIQREQNSIVRDNDTSVMIVQGVAGSGKTSIALHRIAYLLYQNKGHLNSSEVLIISPNNIFSEYISNVLPELGEENILEMNFDEFAKQELKLKSQIKFESKYEQMERIIRYKENDISLEKIRFKNSQIFVKEIKDFVSRYSENAMEFTDIVVGKFTVKAETLENWYNIKFAKKPAFERLDIIAEIIFREYEIELNIDISGKVKQIIKTQLYSMAASSDVVDIYTEFIASISEKYEVLKGDTISGTLKYEDVFPVILLKYCLYGDVNSVFKRIKHVIVDEMQDYSIVQYELMNILFDCNMTLLGDVNQIVDSHNKEILDSICNVFDKKVRLIRMMKSYRSTCEISEFCNNLCNLSDVEPIGRHGNSPEFVKTENYADMVKEIQKQFDEADFNRINTMVVICKSAKAALNLFNELDKEHQNMCYLMNKSDDSFKEGIIITNSYLVKGLEFDSVIIPDVTDKEYVTERDKQILYIACTRALHELRIYSPDKPSEFIKPYIR